MVGSQFKTMMVMIGIRMVGSQLKTMMVVMIGGSTARVSLHSLASTNPDFRKGAIRAKS